MIRYILVTIILPISLFAQFISIKSIPVVTGDQFLLYPSQNLAMGNVSVAIDDPLLDVFNNPAKGNRITGLTLFFQPTFYTVSNNLGGARTLPGTLFIKRGDWFSVISASFQQLEAANLTNPNRFTFQDSKPGDRYSTNRYAFFSIGTKLPWENFSVGGSLYWSDLSAVGGVDLLYNQSTNISQNGDIYELRGGLFYEDDYSSFELVGLYNNYEMLHEVTYRDFFWREDINVWAEDMRIENNLDHTDTYGAHVAYKEKINKEGPQIGAMATVNWKTHPKIPNYEIMNIPRDPGNTWAYNFGIGIGVENEKTRFGLDFIFEPVWSNTWANAEEEIDLGNGRKILPGQKTIENNFTFNNWIGRIGINKIYSSYDFSAGLEINSRRYNLDQFDYIQQSNRSQEENWTEYTWSWGIALHFSRFNLRYNGRLITGSGIPSINQGWGWVTFDNARMAASDIIAAPAGSLTTDFQKVFTHQFVIQIPLSGE
ncbi:MAG: hypothetical protein D8M58_21225 [Calditrichaeota bacterium]|nr:MAG: hypothetical protein DWQ03_16940 [Calditrichota bacterium]MBL1207935.1 hypothetical protein [Calditrichota bacterium]NOG47770.1 hypothetical protein [Calditrichota bacterium]